MSPRQKVPTAKDYSIMDLWDRFERVKENPPDEIRYPAYVLSKGRSDIEGVADLFIEAGVPFRIVVEPQDEKPYGARFGKDRLVVMPKNNGGVTYVRNYAKDHATEEGFDFHWQFDDNIKRFFLRDNGKAHKVDPGWAIRVVEGVVDGYTNIGGANFANSGFVFGYDNREPITLNSQVYCAMLLSNNVRSRFRECHEDTDYSMQLLTEGLVTLSVKRICMEKPASATMKGGNYETAYKGNGRIERMEKLLEYWPGKFRIGYHKDGKPRLVPTGAYKGFNQLPIHKPSSGPGVQRAQKYPTAP
jgi:hypothetical protein